MTRLRVSCDGLMTEPVRAARGEFGALTRLQQLLADEAPDGGCQGYAGMHHGQIEPWMRVAWTDKRQLIDRHRALAHLHATQRYRLGAAK